MSIEALQQISTLSQLAQNAAASSTTSSSTLPFQSLLTDALQDVQSTADTLDTESYKLATGETDDLHDITIASTKYNLAVDLFVQIRNKTLDSYQELMNMSV